MEVARDAERHPAWLALAAAALVAMWCVGLLARNYWTPDEPREAALAASMSAMLAPLPQLAGANFAEKPPLTYWLGAEARNLWGDSPAATRAPQWLYALVGVLSVAWLARALLGARRDARVRTYGAWVAALLYACSELVYQVQIWLDTDALLLAGVALALAGQYAGLSAGTWAARLRGYLIMHAGLTAAFFGKNLAAWLVPALCFFCFIAWEGRWREWLRWELYAGALLPATCILAWVHAVALMPDGMQSLRVLFFDNLLGRALPVTGAAHFDYSSGHRNWPGKYLLELPLYLLPWTLLAITALRTAWPALRAARAAGWATPWRFALCAALPGLAVLSFAATARSIYAAPCLIGFVMLVVLWVSAEGTRAAMLALSAALMTLPAVMLLAIVVALQCGAQRAPWSIFVCACACSALSVALCIDVALRARTARGSTDAARLMWLLQLGIAWSVLLSGGVWPLYGVMNRAQDLERLAARVQLRSQERALLLWQPDETTLAWAQLYLPRGRWSAWGGAQGNVPPQTASTAQRTLWLAAQLRAAGSTLVISEADEPTWTRSRWLEYLRADERQAVDVPALSDPTTIVDPALRAAGLHVSGYVARAGGRGYLLWTAGVP